MVYKRIMKIEISYHVFWTLDQASWIYQLASWIFHCWLQATQQSHPSQFIIFAVDFTRFHNVKGFVYLSIKIPSQVMGSSQRHKGRGGLLQGGLPYRFGYA